jgi:hypothetical protein
MRCEAMRILLEFEQVSGNGSGERTTDAYDADPAFSKRRRDSGYSIFLIGNDILRQAR